MLLTRRIIDPNVSIDYQQAVETVSVKAPIIRIDRGEED